VESVRKKFAKLRKRRHFCSHCGLLVCGFCSNHKHFVAPGELSRICDNCYKHFRSTPDKSAAAAWIPDNECSGCMVCSTSFTVFRRRHHCRSCGKVVCDSCSEKRLLLPAVDKDNLVRACTPCYNAHFTAKMKTSTE